MTTQGAGRPSGPARSRAEIAAELISDLARESGPGVRLGSRVELKERCGVSVGTLHEALRLLQSTGEIVVRTGPGGGIFAGESSALSDLVRSVQNQGTAAQNYAEVARVMNVLNPLIIQDAVTAINADGARLLRLRVDALKDASRGELREFVRASLELFATIAAIPPAGILKAIAGSVLRLQLDTLLRITGAIDDGTRPIVDEHIVAASALVDAIVDRDPARALAARERPEFKRLFATLEVNRLEPPTR